MLRNYFKIAWRNLAKSKLFSAINIIGLSIGIACCTIIYLYVNYELSYDAYNDKADRIFRLTSQVKQPKKSEQLAPTSPIVAQRIKSNFPEVEDFVRFLSSQRPISYKDRKFFDIKVTYADSGLLNIFSFGLIEGDAKKALTAPYSIVLTETAAKRYFGDEPAFGKMMKFSDTINLMVTGIIKDIPRNSHFRTDCFISRSTLADLNKNNQGWLQSQQDWFNCESYAYILIKDKTNPELLQQKINAMLEREMAQVIKDYGMVMHIGLQPVKDIHLRSHLEAEFKGSVNGDINYIYIFSGAAVLILLIACCNFINLSTARSLNRSKEIGLRKVIGAERSQLIFQFLGESLVFAVTASILSLLLLLTGIPLFNAFVGTPIALSVHLLWVYTAIILVVGLLAGIYPALLMSSFAPVQSLKGRISHGISDIIFRKGLVVFQFSIAIILIIGTTLILKQLDFLQSRNIGLRKEQVLLLKMKAPDTRKSDLLLKELLRNPKVKQGTVNNFSFNGVANITLLPEGFADNELTSSYVIAVDENFLKTYQIPVVAGRDFSKDFPSDATEGFLINEASVRAYNWKSPKEALGKHISWGLGKEGRVVGVVKDFNFVSLHEPIKPLLIHIFPPWYNTISLRLETNDLPATMTEIERTWKSIATQSPFDYSFAEEDFNNLYHSERMMRNVLGAFTFLSILVACLGLFGLASFTIKQRVKEIGIRKVLGSSVSGIIQLLSKDFLKLVLIAFVIASPLAWYAIHKWLQDYAYRIDIGVFVFVLAGSLAFIIAFLTVSVQATRAALSNPVKSLRTE